MQLIASGLEILEASINSYLALDEDIAPALGRLHGKVIAIEITGFALCIYFIPTPSRLQLLSRIEGDPDCTIKGTLGALVKLSGPEKNHQLFGGDVKISGDTALAHRFGQIMASIDIDWEEHLSRLVGDIPAHQAGRLIKNIRASIKSSAQTLEQDSGEYLQEEIGFVPRPVEIQEFCDDIDLLRDAVDRIEARITRLQQLYERTKP